MSSGRTQVFQENNYGRVLSRVPLNNGHISAQPFHHQPSCLRLEAVSKYNRVVPTFWATKRLYCIMGLISSFGVLDGDFPMSLRRTFLGIVALWDDDINSLRLHALISNYAQGTFSP